MISKYTEAEGRDKFYTPVIQKGFINDSKTGDEVD